MWFPDDCPKLPGSCPKPSDSRLRPSRIRPKWSVHLPRLADGRLKLPINRPRPPAPCPRFPHLRRRHSGDHPSGTSNGPQPHSGGTAGAAPGGSRSTGSLTLSEGQKGALIFREGLSGFFDGKGHSQTECLGIIRPTFRGGASPSHLRPLPVALPFSFLEEAAMWESHQQVGRWLWTHNPFYFISALLMRCGTDTANRTLGRSTVG